MSTLTLTGTIETLEKRECGTTHKALSAEYESQVYEHLAVRKVEEVVRRVHRHSFPVNDVQALVALDDCVHLYAIDGKGLRDLF